MLLEGDGDPTEVMTPDDSQVRWVAAALVDRAGKTRGAVAELLGLEATNLSNQLRRPTGPSLDLLVRLQLAREELGGPASDPTWLTSFAEEVRRTSDADVHVPAGWFAELVRAGHARSTVEVVARGAALASVLTLTRDEKEQDRLLANVIRGPDGPSRMERAAEDTVRALLDVACGPPNGATRAIHLLARLAPVVLRPDADGVPLIMRHVYGSPVGFRAVRVLTRILLTHGDSGDDKTINRVGALLRKIAEDEPPDAYPARSFFVESLRFAPAASVAGDAWHWVDDELAKRAEAVGTRRPVRERAYALFALATRAPAEAEQLIARLKKQRDQKDDGVAYAIDFAERLLAGAKRGEFPDRPETARVTAAADAIDAMPNMPASIAHGFKLLVRESVLQIDGTRRRRACEVIQAAGLAGEAVSVLNAVLQNPEASRWEREHSAFIIGVLQSPHGVRPLIDLADRESSRADAELRDWRKDSKRIVGGTRSVRHAALWGIGDIAGAGADVTSPDFQLADVVETVSREASRRPTRATPGVLSVERVRWAALYAAAQILFRLVDQQDVRVVMHDDKPLCEPVSQNAEAHETAERLTRVLSDVFRERPPRSDDRLREVDKPLSRWMATWALNLAVSRSATARARELVPPFATSVMNDARAR